MSRLIGYARVSTDDQEAGLLAQQRDLIAAGCTVYDGPHPTYVERASAVGHRPCLDAAIKLLEPGDVLVVTKLDRLARNVHHLCQVVERIKAKGASLRILAMGLDTGTPTGTLMLNVLGAVAQFEREIMLERQREGIAKAKAAGKYKGRTGTDRAAVKEVYRAQSHTPELALSVTAEKFGLSVRQVQRIVRGK